MRAEVSLLLFFSIFLLAKALPIDQKIVDFAVSQFSGIEKDNDCHTLKVENFQSKVDLSVCMIVIDIDCVFSPACGKMGWP